MEGIADWPDGTVTVQYGFRHALYQQVLYEQTGRARRIRLHQQLGIHKEVSYGDRAAHGKAQAHHALVLELYEPEQHRELVLRFSVDPAVVAWVRSGWSLWLAGWPDRARARLQEGLCWARELSHP